MDYIIIKGLFEAGQEHEFNYRFWIKKLRNLKEWQ